MGEETTVKKFFELISEQKLCAAHCSSCDALYLPPRLICPNCNRKTTDWTQLSGEGTIRSFTVIHIAGTRYAQDIPYIVAIIGLKEGPSVCARLVGVDPLKPEDIHVGDAVVADFEEIPGLTVEEKDALGIPSCLGARWHDCGFKLLLDSEISDGGNSKNLGYFDKVIDSHIFISSMS